jgi:hypothetical protein
MRTRTRGASTELFFSDPDGLAIQLTDTKFCGGAGSVGEVCSVLRLPQKRINGAEGPESFHDQHLERHAIEHVLSGTVRTSDPVEQGAALGLGFGPGKMFACSPEAEADGAERLHRRGPRRSIMFA